MYLTRKTYIGANYEHRKVKGSTKITIDGEPVKIDFKKITHIEEQVGYWRKANQIHKWFVDNIQDGNDDCREYELPKEKAIELLEICKKVKASSKLKDGKINNGTVTKGGKTEPIIEDGKVIINNSVAKNLLPTASGFFFGSTDYDEYYMQDIDNTIEILENLLKEEDPKKDYFENSVYYSSSW